MLDGDGVYRYFVIALTVSGLMNLGLSGFAWRYRHKAVGRAFIGLTLMMSIFSLSSLFAVLSPNIVAADFWMNRMRFVGVDLVPVCFLVFVLACDSRHEFLTPGRLGALVVFPLLDLVVIFSNHWHHAFIHKAEFHKVDGFFLRNFWEPGPWFWVHTGYCYVLILCGLLLLAYSAWKRPLPYCAQARLMLVGVFLPLLGNVFATWRLAPEAALDLTAFNFTFTALIFAYSLYRYQLLDLVPVARDKIIESLDDGVVVLDLQGRIIEINQAAESILGIDKELALGRGLKEFLPVSYDFVAMLRDSERRVAEIVTKDRNGRERIYDFKASRLVSAGGWVGVLLLARDVSERVAMIDDRETIIKELEAARTELVHQVRFDQLTRIYSRRYFLELAFQEMVRALRYHRPLSLLMIDIDRFKNCNDTYGHEFGDRVLFRVAQVIKQEVRSTDIAARFGGEEFVVLLPESGLEAARLVAEKIRLKVQEISSEYFAEVEEMFLTVSIGLAAMLEQSQGIDELLRLADAALYEAKAAGRNCLREKVPSV